MDWPIQLGIAVLEVVGATCLGVFLYHAVSKPDRMSLGLEGATPKTLGGRVYLGIVVVSWSAVVFSGLLQLLAWMPGEGVLGIVGMATLASLLLLAHLERSAYVANDYARLWRVQSELQKLISYATSPNPATIEAFQAKADSPDLTKPEREAYRTLARVAGELAERDAKLCEASMQRLQREADEKSKARQQEEVAAASRATKEARRAKLRQRFAVGDTVATAKTIDGIPAGSEALIEQQVLRPKWQALRSFAERLRSKPSGIAVAELLRAVPGVQYADGTQFDVVLNGSERDGFFEVTSAVNGTSGDLVDGLKFEASVDGVLAAFFLRVVLPTELAWGHGCYGRDQELLLLVEAAVSLLDAWVDPDTPGLAAIQRPVGVRLYRDTTGAIGARCLAYRPNKGIGEYEVSVTDGKASPVKETQLLDCGVRIFY